MAVLLLLFNFYCLAGHSSTLRNDAARKSVLLSIYPGPTKIDEVGTNVVVATSLSSVTPSSLFCEPTNMHTNHMTSACCSIETCSRPAVKKHPRKSVAAVATSTFLFRGKCFFL